MIKTVPICQVRNHESERVSMPGQVVSSNGVLTAKIVEDMVETEQGQGGGPTS